MTDYTDGEAGEALKKEVERHVALCGRCREFQEALRQAAIEPFKKAEAIEPPDFVWSRIEESIARERKPVRAPLVKPAFAVAAVIAALMVAVIFARVSFDGQKAVDGYAVSGYLEEQLTFLAYLDNDIEESYNGDYTDMGTGIEEYFM